VLWRRPDAVEERGTVLPFPGPRRQASEDEEPDADKPPTLH
jgi:hypothetical protein